MEDTDDEDDNDADSTATAAAVLDVGAAEVLSFGFLLLLGAPSWLLSTLLAMGVANAAADPPPREDADVTTARSLRLRLILSCKREEAEPPAPFTTTEILVLAIDDDDTTTNGNDDDGVAAGNVVVVVAVSFIVP